jgi:hypothetical protein
MDSGNSGSLQSSSGGDDEFDSRCGGGEDSSPLSALLRPPSLLPTGSFYGIQDLDALPQLPHPAQWLSTPLPAGTATGQTEAPCAQVAPAATPRGSRKRTRASRRAPTTVLTTDTSNFRAMVQEFTGVPAPPFAAAGARSRLPSSHPAAAPSPYLLLRPFAQRLQHNQAAPYHPPVVAAPPPPAANKAVASSAAPSTAAGSSGDGYRLASAPFGVLGMQGHSSGGNYMSFQSPPVGNNGSRYPSAHHMLDAAVQRLPDSSGISVLAQGQLNPAGTHLHRPPRDGGYGSDELSGMIGTASVSGCKAVTTYSSGGAGSRAAPPLPAERNAESTTMTPAVRAQGVVDSSWICTSD